MELVVSGNPAVVHAIEDKTNRKLLRLIADIKESLLLEVITVLQPFDNATKRLSCDTSADIAPFAELCSISNSHFRCFAANEYLETLTGFSRG